MAEQNSELSSELLAMAEEQKAVMDRTGGGTVGPVAVEHRQVQREVFVRHADRLRAILEEHRWPTAELVGSDAAHAAWIVAQHADTQLDVQRLAVVLLREAVATGRAEPRVLAFLEDRLAVTEGRRQRFGTQIADVVDGRPVPWPIEDPEHLDERRESVGIESFAANAARYGA